MKGATSIKKRGLKSKGICIAVEMRCEEMQGKMW